MKFDRDEIVGICIATAVAAGFFAVIRYDIPTLFQGDEDGDVIRLEEDTNAATALREAFSVRGEVTKLIVEDVRVGTGPEVVKGSRVEVHYVGMLPDGTKFDSSYDHKAPYPFTVGQGDVIKGWEQGILGMRQGGARVLVVPAELAYGDRAVGDVPPNATLLFSIELISVQ